MRYSLDGAWELSSGSLSRPIVGRVPGNIELDLWQAGLEPEPFHGTNSLCYRKYGYADWCYRQVFATPQGMAGDCTLVLEGVDCCGEIWLNGRLVGRTMNAFIEHRLPVTLKGEGEENVLEVRLRSAEKAAQEQPEEYGAIEHIHQANSNLWMRRPAHSYGWDIAPKFNLGGLWRGVYVEKADADTVFRELWVSTKRLGDGWADLDVYYAHEARGDFREDLRLRVKGVCGESVFELETGVYNAFGHAGVRVRAPKLWWPYGSGEPNLYDVTAELVLRGETVGRCRRRFGIRTVELDRSDINVAGTGWFRFKVNGVVTRMFGSNWVPADAFHSQDPKREIDILKLFSDSHCNMLRCWGGGVYEDEAFYDYCDEHGLLVWQDFMFSGHKYPQHAAFLEQVRTEAEAVVRRLRHHTCLALWCGDNECDQKYLGHQEDPRKNRVNREVLPEVLYRLDPTRPYLASSPYLADEAFRYADERNGEALTKLMPERHLWGSRENFRQPFYTAVDAKFVSEMGWHGCPSLSSLRKYIDEAELKLDTVDLRTPQLCFHASCPWEESGLRGRNDLMVRQNEEYFTDAPGDLANFVLANQICQGEAFKYVVEHYRLQRDCGGILWWNIMDCWPQLSDAVVDYYFNRKLAYYYLKRTQQPLALLCRDTMGYHSEITVVNDTAREQRGRFTVTDGESGELLLSGEFCAGARSLVSAGRLRNRRSVNALWLLEWELADGTCGANHFIAGNRVMSYAWYKALLPKIGALDGAFRLDGLEVVQGAAQ